MNKTSPQAISKSKEPSAKRKFDRGDESKPTIVLTIANKIRVLFYELEKKGVLKIVKCWNFGESFYGTRHSERFSRLYQQKSTNFYNRSGSLLSGVRLAD